MPTYNFQDKETGEILEKVMKISEKDTFLKDNPHLKSVILDVAPATMKSKFSTFLILVSINTDPVLF